MRLEALGVQQKQSRRAGQALGSTGGVGSWEVIIGGLRYLGFAYRKQGL